MSLATNLANAKSTVDYVKKKVPIGASNKLSDIFASRGESLGCVVGSRIGQQLEDIGVFRAAWAAGKLRIEVLALGTEKAGCGNCGEQSAVAWVYLWKNLRVTPIDWMCVAGGDHAFVVIGRSAKSSPEDYSTWGKEAVVCDPWDNKAYAARYIHNFMKGTPRFKSMLWA